MVPQHLGPSRRSRLPSGPGHLRRSRLSKSLVYDPSSCSLIISRAFTWDPVAHYISRPGTCPVTEFIRNLKKEKEKKILISSCSGYPKPQTIASDSETQPSQVTSPLHFGGSSLTVVNRISQYKSIAAAAKVAS